MTKNSAAANVQVKSIVSTTPQYRNKDFLIQKYSIEGMSARQIADIIGCGHSTINDALVRFGISKEPRKPGWVEYGFKIVDGKRVAHVRQQNILQQIARKRKFKWSNSEIADWLNSRGVSSPTGKTSWSASTVRFILKRNKK